ncbi:hypothetical protein BKI52_38765 [marine bacterium AO1-C]|nr:hypothetical protein BKI52_38765 [marine bacterium AO1-C]
MLSQKISKEALLLVKASDKKAFADQWKLLKADLTLWNRSHQGLLQGDAKLQLPKTELDQINQKYFKEIAVFKHKIEEATQSLLKESFAAKQPQKEKWLNIILANEKSFLGLMNKITFRFEEVAKQKVSSFQRIELFLMCFTLFLLLVEGVYIFRPTFNKIKESVMLLQENAEEIDAQNQMLSGVLTKMQRQNDNIASSIRYAKTIQDASLSLDPSVHSCLDQMAFILFRPLQVVSGDFYYVADTPEETIFAAVDCQGHGIPGAFLSMIGVSILNDVVKAKGITKPGEVLNSLHQTVRKTLRQASTNNRDSMDLALITINKYSNEVLFAGAKNPLIYVTDNQVHEVKGDRRSIGGKLNAAKASFTTHAITIEKATTFYIFSDGYIDQFGGPDKRKFLRSRLKKSLLNLHSKPLKQQKKSLDQNLERWMQEGNESQIDDILVMGVKLYPI